MAPSLEDALAEDNNDEVRRIIGSLEDKEACMALSRALLTFCSTLQVEAVRRTLDFWARPGIRADPDAIPPGSDFPPLCVVARSPCDDKRSVADIIGLLLSHKADRCGRDNVHRANAIMWATEEETVNALLDSLDAEDRKRYINNRDEDGRTALIWAAERNADEGFLEFLVGKGADGTITDYQGNSPLHCAAEKGNVVSAEALLTKFYAQIDCVNYGGRTPLHLAAGKNQVEMVDMLLKKHAKVGVQSSGGWSPLHFACNGFDGTNDGRNADVVRLLLHNSEPEQWGLSTTTGMTPLHVAAEAGNIDAIFQLLRYISKQVEPPRRLDTGLQHQLLCAPGKQDDAGNVALFNHQVYRADRSWILEQLAPWNTRYVRKERLESEPSRHFNATVVDFLSGDQTIQVTEPSIFNLIYAATDVSYEALRIASPRKEYNYRWIHLPANKRSWCLDLFARCFIEMSENEREGDGLHEDSGKKEADLFQAMARTLSYQRTGRAIHSRYMRTMCRSVCADETDVVQNAASHFTGAEAWNTDDDDDDDDDDSENLPHGHSPIGEARASGHTSKSLHLYMPYLHYEEFGEMQRMKKALDESLPPSHDAYNGYLLNGLHGEEYDYHPRRTLDQFLHRSMDTDERDQDQVVFRYQREPKPRGLEIPDDKCKVIMVDQLWLWVVNEKLIITSFPQCMNKQFGDSRDVRERILNHVSAKGARTVPTVYELAGLIADTCSKARDVSDMGEQRFLDMFESSIGNAMEDAVRSSRKLNDAAKEARLWLRSMNEERDAEDTQEVARDLNTRTAALGSVDLKVDAKEKGSTHSMQFVDSLLDLKLETDLLYSVNDVRDEIDMLSLVMRLQRRVLEDMSGVLSADGQHMNRRQSRMTQDPQTQMNRLDSNTNAVPRPANGPSSDANDRRRSEISANARKIDILDNQRIAISRRRAAAVVRQSARSVQRTITELNRMEKQAKRIYSTVTDSLDLKQRYANAIEARYVRAGGTTIMIFTTATVFFLPASFIVSMFQLNLSGMPRQDGELPTSLVLPLVLGLGFFVGVAYLVVGLNVNEIGRWWRAPRKSREAQPRPNSIPQAGPTAVQGNGWSKILGSLNHMHQDSMLSLEEGGGRVVEPPPQVGGKRR